MFDALTAMQLLLSCGLMAVVVERTHYLLYVAPLSSAAMSWVRERIVAQHRNELRAFARAVPRTHVAQLLEITLADGDTPDLHAELTERTLARLRLVRVGATLASTVGLLVGIMRLSGHGQSPGLLALEAGLPQRIATAQALWAMGIGVGTSAVCFYALSILGKAAKELLSQGARAHALLSAQSSASTQNV